jgi:hypothetical protein
MTSNLRSQAYLSPTSPTCRAFSPSLRSSAPYFLFSDMITTTMATSRCPWIMSNIPTKRSGSLMMTVSTWTRLVHFVSDVISFSVTAASVFSGISTFAKLPWVDCLGSKGINETFDIAFIGAPFVGSSTSSQSNNIDLTYKDTGTSYRPGARFGPAGIRSGSRRLRLYGGYNVGLKVNPFLSGLKVVDCGDIPVTP